MPTGSRYTLKCLHGQHRREIISTIINAPSYEKTPTIKCQDAPDGLPASEITGDGLTAVSGTLSGLLSLLSIAVQLPLPKPPS